MNDDNKDDVKTKMKRFLLAADNLTSFSLNVVDDMMIITKEIATATPLAKNIIHLEYRSGKGANTFYYINLKYVRRLLLAAERMKYGQNVFIYLLTKIRNG